MKVRILPPGDMLDAELEMPLSKSMSVRAAAMAAAGAAHVCGLHTLRHN